MEFFDRKEEVLEIQLTQRGKKLLAEGEFKPHYYQFFDDDILYDTTGCGFDEAQNSSVPRIKETPRPKTLNIVHGVETEFNIEKQLKFPKQDKKVYPHNKNHEGLRYALGIADYSKNFMPAWSISLKTGQFTTSSFSQFYSPEPDYYENIPQLYCTCSYLYETKKNKTYEYISEEEIDKKDDVLYFKSPLYEDQTYYTIRERNNLHIVLNEVNSIFDKENFDVEVFEVQTTSKQKEKLTKLSFNEIFYLQEDNIIGGPIQDEDNEIKPTDVEWYFGVLNDEDIREAQEATAIPDFVSVDEAAIDSENPC